MQLDYKKLIDDKKDSKMQKVFFIFSNLVFDNLPNFAAKPF